MGCYTSCICRLKTHNKSVVFLVLSEIQSIIAVTPIKYADGGKTWAVTSRVAFMQDGFGLPLGPEVSNF